MNFCNKMWNAFRLVKGWEVSNEAASESNKKAIEWMNAKIRSAYAEINDDYDKYRLNEALMAAFKLFTTSSTHSCHSSLRSCGNT